MLTLYGIKNCDTVKKARNWLEDAGLDYHFHDFRGDGLDESTLQDWCEKIEWKTLLNQRSTSWRQLSEEERQQIANASTPELSIKAMLATPTLIKRPVLIQGDTLMVGFKAESYEQLL